MTRPSPGSRPSPLTAPAAAAAALLLAGLASACDEARSEAAAAWEAAVDTVGDTVVVRTLSGSAWGDTADLVPEVEIGVLDGAEEYMFGRVTALAVAADGGIWVLDGQAPALRLYDADGRYVRTAGGQGAGPGEYERPDGGLNVLSDGRVLLRDPSNARINVYDADGEPLDTWLARGSLSTSRPLYVDRRDNSWTLVLLDAEASVFDWTLGLAQYRSDGTPGDTILPPDLDYEAPRISGESEGSTSIRSVPFSPGESWTLSPLGYVVHGLSTDYAFTLLRPEGPLRIERTAAPVPVEPGEAAEERAAAEASMRRNFPGWRWNGPPVPDVKPPWRDLEVGRDGRIWVRVSLPGYEVEAEPADPDDPFDVPDRWREPLAWDVFEPDGRFLGHVRAPRGFASYPHPVFGTDHVWATTEDELGVQKVVRFRIALPGDGGTG